MKIFDTNKTIHEKTISIFNRKILSLGRKKDRYLIFCGVTVFEKRINEDKVEYNFLGIKFQVRNKLWNIESRIRKIEHICSYANTPEMAHPAVGYGKLIQQASVILLRDVMRVCKEAEIECWLSYGTALGLYRHGGIIPWDDDIDVAMCRSDYNRFIDIYNQLGNKNFRAIYYTHENGRYNFCKIISNVNNVFVDIFPQDIDGRDLTIEEMVADVNSNKNLLLNDTSWKKYRKNRESQETLKEYHNHLISLCNKKHDQNLHSNAIVFMGAECNIDNPCVCNTGEAIFPLQDVIFEGVECKAPHDIELYLYQMFGDFMNYPPIIETHCNKKNVTKKDMIECLAFVRKYS